MFLRAPPACVFFIGTKTFSLLLVLTPYTKAQSGTGAKQAADTKWVIGTKWEKNGQSHLSDALSRSIVLGGEVLSSPDRCWGRRARHSRRPPKVEKGAHVAVVGSRKKSRRAVWFIASASASRLYQATAPRFAAATRPLGVEEDTSAAIAGSREKLRHAARFAASTSSSRSHPGAALWFGATTESRSHTPDRRRDSCRCWGGEQSRVRDSGEMRAVGEEREKKFI